MPGAGPEHAVRVLSKNRSRLGLKRPFRPRTRIQFYGMFRGAWSISTVCTAFGRELTRRLGGVALESYDGGRYFDTGLERFSHVDNDAPVGIFYGFPNEIPEAFQRHPFRVGGFVCETDRIDASWVDACNTLDLVVVPSTFCRRAFGDSGVQTPTMVVPHGLEPEYQPTRPKHRTTPLVFYNTFHESSLLPRKSVDELIGCFLEAFGRTGERAVLNLRTELSHQLVDVRKRHDFGEAVRLRPMEHLDTASFAALYSEVHCTVHPSKGEGFGLVPLQSIACETPVIATAATGMVDYLDDTNSIGLRTAGRVTGDKAGSAAGTYFAIDEDHLVASLLDVHERWEDRYEQVRLAAPDLRRRYAWPIVLDEVVRTVDAAADPAQVDEVRRELQARHGPARPE